MMRFVITIAFFLVSGGVAVLGVFPLWTEIRNARAEITGLIQENDELQEIADTRGKLTAQYRAIPQEDIDRLSEILPSGFATGQYLKDIEALAARHTLLLENIDFVQKDQSSSLAIRLPAQQRFTPIGVSFVVRGSYESFRLFLAELERLVRVTDVTDISFTTQSGSVSGAASSVFEYAVKGQIYYRQ